MSQTPLKRIGSFVINTNEILGKGSFGTVYKAFNEKTQQKVAVKVIVKSAINNNQDPKKLVDSLQREIEAMKKTKGKKYILEMLDIQQSTNNIYIFLELCEDSLYDHWLKNKPLSEAEIKLIFVEIINAFKSIDSANILHRDIKPQNILIKNQMMKIADFGFAKVVEDTELIQKQTLLGTPKYVAPEILFGKPYNNKVDVFSVAVVIFELIFNVHPYFNSTFGVSNNFACQKYPMLRQKYIELEPKNIIPFHIPIFSNKIDSQFEDLLGKMLQIDQDKRIGWIEVFTHPYLINLEQQAEQLNQKIKNEPNDFMKSVYMQQQFLANKRVYGKIQENIADITSPLSPTKTIQMTDQKSTLAMFDNELATKKDLRFNEYNQFLLNERNQAVLNFEFFSKLQSNENIVFQYFGQSLTYQLQFCTTKMGVQLLKSNPIYRTERFTKFLKMQLTEDYSSKNSIADTTDIPKVEQQILNEYLASQQYHLNKGKIENDIMIQETTFDGFISSYQQHFYQDLSNPISCQLLQLIQNKQPLQFNIVKEVLNIALSKCHIGLPKPLLQIWMLLLVSLAPYKYFPINKDNNYHIFYESLEKNNEATLIQRISEMLKNTTNQ